MSETLKKPNIIKELNLVQTISGKKVSRKDCIKIRDKYHEKNVDCFKIRDKWTSIHYNALGYDVVAKEYEYMKHLRPVVLSYNTTSMDAEIGHSRTFYGNGFCLPKHDSSTLFYTVDKNGYDMLEIQECVISGFLYPYGQSPYKKNIQKYKKDLHDFKYAVSLEKAIENELSDSVIDSFGLRSKTFKKTNKLKYTFGVEIETSGGVIPKSYANGRLNIDYIYDGSVYDNSGNKYGGGEIVTGPLIGDNGVKHLSDIMYQAKERCVVNPTCGLHMHIGGWKYTPEFIVNTYALGYFIQDDLFSYMPKKRKFQVDYRGNILGDNVYCKMLPHLELIDMYTTKDNSEYKDAVTQNYNTIFKWLCGQKPNSKLNKNHNHPKGHKCGYDHNSPRYSWLNLVPATFNTRGNKVYTVEFRNHGETLSFKKTYYWLMFCLAFVKFCENHANWIAKGLIEFNDVKHDICVKSIISVVYANNSKLKEELLDYFAKRLTFFTNNLQAVEEDFICV